MYPYFQVGVGPGALPQKKSSMREKPSNTFLPDIF